MKSVTVTTHKAINYGAVLQAYALQKVQESYGIENEILDVPRLSRIFEKIPRKFNRRLLIVAAMNVCNVIHYREQKRLRQGFDAFLRNYLKQTRFYADISEVCRDLPKADFYINGSDQVFGLRGEQDDLRMLTFVPSGIPKYSYAGSLGEYDWNETERHTFASRLNAFRGISVREAYAKQYLSDLVDREIAVHMDPTFMLDRKEWEKLAVKPNIREKYILLFPLVSNPSLAAAVERIQKQTGYQVVCLQPYSIRRYQADLTVCDATPEEFLGWILHSEMVLSTSFHGTAFSVIFHKPFYSFTKAYKSQRITELLEQCGLSDRLYTEETNPSFQIDFSTANRTIRREQERCKEYFYKIIEDCKND